MGVMFVGLVLVVLALTTAVLVTVLVRVAAALRLRRAALVGLLATAVRAGRSLPDEFDALGDTLLRGDRRRAWPVGDALRRGEPLSEALARGGGLFPPRTVAAARVGEATGNLADALAAEADRLAGRRDPLSGLAGGGSALPGLILYLTVLPIVFANLTAFLMYWVVPKFKRILEDFGLEVPPWTRRLIGFADGAGWVTPALLGCFCPVAFAVLLVVGVQRGGGRRLIPRRPGTRGAGAMRAAASAVRTDSPTPAALRALAGPHDDLAVSHAADLIDGGDDEPRPLGDALHAAGLATRDERDALLAAEAAGTLPWTLTALAEARERRGGTAARAVLELSRPLAVFVLGAVTLLIALACFEPLLVMMDSLTEVER